MEYLILAGRDLKSSLSGSLGDFSPFFWSIVAPIGLAILWIGSIYALWEVWFRGGAEGGSGSSLFVKVFFSFLMLAAILASGAGLEYLLLGDGVVHAQILGALIELVGPR